MYAEKDGSCPFVDWYGELPVKVQAKCLLRLERLGELGHELRRPEGDYLRDGIHELRLSFQHVQYRILYFFHGRVAAVVSHGIVKQGKVPAEEIERAIQRKKRFETDPSRHSHSKEIAG